APFPPTYGTECAFTGLSLSSTAHIGRPGRARKTWKFVRAIPQAIDPNPSGADFCPLLPVQIQWVGARFGHFTIYYDFLHPIEAGQVEHGAEQDLLHDGAKAAGAGLAGNGPDGDGFQCVLREGELDPLHFEEP